MTNEFIFCVIGLILGVILGYAIRCLMPNEQTVTIVVKTNKEDEDNDEWYEYER